MGTFVPFPSCVSKPRTARTIFFSFSFSFIMSEITLRVRESFWWIEWHWNNQQLLRRICVHWPRMADECSSGRLCKRWPDGHREWGAYTAMSSFFYSQRNIWWWRLLCVFGAKGRYDGNTGWFQDRCHARYIWSHLNGMYFIFVHAHFLPFCVARSTLAVIINKYQMGIGDGTVLYYFS